MHPRRVLVVLGLASLTACVPASESAAPTSAVARPPVVSRGPRVAVPLLVEPLTDLGLFREERDAVERDLFAWGKSQGLSLVPLERTRTILDRAAAGQRIDTGESCGAELPLWRAKARYAGALGAAGSLRPVVLCDAKTRVCHLDVDVLDRLELGADYLASYRAPFDATRPWREAYTLALHGLAPVKDEDEGGGLAIGDLHGGLASVARPIEPESFVVEARSATVGDRSETVPGGAVVKGGLSPLRACFGADESVETLVDVSADGAILRCEPGDAEGPAATCACHVLMKQAEGAPVLRGARAWVSVRLRAGTTTTRSGSVVDSTIREYLDRGSDSRGHAVFHARVSDPSIADWRPPPSRLVDRCFVGLEETRQVHVAVTVHFDVAGKASAVDVQVRQGAAPDADETACLKEVMLASKVPCPATPVSWATAHVDVRTHPAKKPEAAALP